MGVKRGIMHSGELTSLLDGLALILVAEKLGVAAVTLENLGTFGFNIYYTRNWPCSRTEEDYALKILGIVKNPNRDNYQTV